MGDIPGRLWPYILVTTWLSLSVLPEKGILSQIQVKPRFGITSSRYVSLIWRNIIWVPAILVHFDYDVPLIGYIEVEGQKHGSRVLRTYPDGVHEECGNTYGNCLDSLFNGSIVVVIYHSIVGNLLPEILECPLEEGV